MRGGRKVIRLCISAVCPQERIFKELPTLSSFLRNAYPCCLEPIFRLGPRTFIRCHRHYASWESAGKRIASRSWREFASPCYSQPVHGTRSGRRQRRDQVNENGAWNDWSQTVEGKISAGALCKGERSFQRWVGSEISAGALWWSSHAGSLAIHIGAEVVHINPMG